MQEIQPSEWKVDILDDSCLSPDIIHDMYQRLDHHVIVVALLLHVGRISTYYKL